MIHVNKERLGDFIGSERKNLGLTQRDLAARLHVTDKAVSKWERGQGCPDVGMLPRLAKILASAWREFWTETCFRRRRMEEI